MIGQVEMFNRQKGYGFIRGDDSRRYYCPGSNVRIPSKSLDRGYTVTFTPALNSRGYVAENVYFL